MTDLVINATDAWPVRASLRNRDVAHELPLARLQRLVAADPPLALAISRGLRDWEQGRVSSDVCVGAGRYRAGEWAGLEYMGYTGAEDEGMVGGEWEAEESVKQESPPPQSQTTTTKTASHYS